MKSYNELRSEFTRTRQEMAELKRISDESRADQLRKAQEEEQRNRELYMSDEEKELIELQKKIVEPVLQPYKEELERLKQERVSEDRTQKERQRVMTDQSIYAKFIEATPVAKTVEKQFWYLAQQE